MKKLHSRVAIVAFAAVIVIAGCTSIDSKNIDNEKRTVTVKEHVTDHTLEGKRLSNKVQAAESKEGWNEESTLNQIVEDVRLQNAILSIYCKNTKTESVTADTLTYGEMQSITGDIDFSGIEDADRIVSIAGLGSLKGASSLNISDLTSVTEIPDEEFMENTNLTTVILSDSVNRFGKRAFAKSGLQSMYVQGAADTDGVYIPDSVTELGEGCFYGDAVMKKVSLCPNLMEITDYLFDGCSKLAVVEQRQKDENGKKICKVTQLGDAAFRGTAITDTKFLLNMNQLKDIGKQHLTDFTVDKGVWKGLSETNAKSPEQAIGSIATGGIDDKMTVDASGQKKRGNKALGSEVFSACPNLVSVEIPASVETIASRAFYYPGYRSNAAAAIQTVTWESSANGNTSGIRRIIYPGAFQGNDQLTKVTLPYAKGESLEIGKFAFAYNTELCEIGVAGQESGNVLPSSVTKMETGAFFNCQSLPSIVIADTEDGSGIQLGDMLFEGCITMTKATLPGSITEIPRHCFYNVPLLQFSVGTGKSGDGDDLNKIGTLAFYGNQFETVDLSKYSGLKEIGEGAFAFCDWVSESSEEGNTAKIVKPQKPTNGKEAKLQTVILPDKMDHTLFIDSVAFYEQRNFTTMSTPSNNIADTIFIPSYMIAGQTRALFGCTGVSKVVWQADQAGADVSNCWKDIPTLMFESCDKIIKAEDVLPKGDYVVSIGRGAFINSSVQSVDISTYKNLTLLGSGSLKGTYTDSYNGEHDLTTAGVFEQCLKLEKVVLPDAEQANGIELVIGEKTFAISNKTVDAYKKEVANGQVPDYIKLRDVSFGRTTEIRYNAFDGCVGLQHVEFGNVKTIGNYAFRNCSALTFTVDDNLGDKIETIGSNAFQNDQNLGNVVFPASIHEIGDYAFDSTKLKSVEFDKARELNKIGTYAFKNTDITEFRLEGTKVKVIPAYMLSACPKLTDAVFDDSVTYISTNAIVGCAAFHNLTYAATTTVSRDLFKNAVKVNGTQVCTAKDHNYAINVSITAPDEPIKIPMGQDVTLPYYVNEKGKAALESVLIGQNADDAAIQESIRLSACLTDGYYWGTTQDSTGSHSITNTDYYNQLSQSESQKINGKDVDVVRFKALKSGQFDLTVTADVSFNCAQNSTITASKVAVTYQFIVDENAKFQPAVYRDQNCTDSVADGTPISIQATANNNKGTVLYYFTMQTEKGMEAAISTYDIVAISDHPEVAYPASAANAAYLDDGYSTANCTVKNNTTGTITPNKNYMKFYLVTKGVGTANITIYPKDHVGEAEYGVTFPVTVNSDIDTIMLAVPSEYMSGAEEGAEFAVFNGYKNMFGQVADADNMATVGKIYSNRTITFTSKEPQFATVNSDGVVRILKTIEKNKMVQITASADNEKALEQTINIIIKGTGSTTTTEESNTSISSEKTTTTEKPGATTEKPGVTTEKPGVTTEKPGVTTEKPGVTTEKPGVTTEKPGVTTEKPGVTTEKPGVTTEKPGVTTEKPGVTTEKPGVTTEKPGATTEKPGVTTEKPGATTEKPGATTEKPGVTTEKPGVTTEKPGATTEKPGVTTEKPGVTTEKPEATTEKPGVTTEKPEATTEKPGATTEKTATTTEKSVSTTDKSYYDEKTNLTKDSAITQEITNGTLLNMEAEQIVYQVVDAAKKEVQYVSNSSTNKKVVIPETITINGTVYNVTSIADKAFSGNKKLTSVTIGKNITSIGKNAFAGCKNLKQIVIKSSGIKKINKNAFKGIHKKAKIKVPKKQYAKYKKLLKKAKLAKSVKIKK